MNQCDECLRWQERIEAAAAADDQGKVKMLQSLYRGHLESEHGARVVKMGERGLWPGREVIVMQGDLEL
jgi:hypothetical protein